MPQPYLWRTNWRACAARAACAACAARAARAARAACAAHTAHTARASHTACLNREVATVFVRQDAVWHVVFDALSPRDAGAQGVHQGFLVV